MASLTLDTNRLVRDITRQVNEEVGDEFAKIKLDQLKEANRRNFRNRTGRLSRSTYIRPGTKRVGIGGPVAFYWVHIDNKMRGTGEFVRRWATTGNDRALVEAFQIVNARGTLGRF